MADITTVSSGTSSTRTLIKTTSGECITQNAQHAAPVCSDTSALRRYLFNDAEVKSFDSAQLASECFGGEMTVESHRKVGMEPVSPLTDACFIFQTKTYDSVTDKFMDFSFEKVTPPSESWLILQDW